MKTPENKAKTNNIFSEMEDSVLSFWDKADIFNKSVERKAPQGDYVFYDGPPFATGTPHYGHIVASVMKDAVPRFWTMNGYRVERRWGWDCHGLPIENIVEKEMGSKSKKDIEEAGVEKFNEMCRSKVLGYVDEWERVIRRLGRWADMKNSYKTMDKDFMESVWWVFKELYDKGLIYEGHRSMHVCPRCETTLSQQEVAEGYKDIKDLSCIAKFEIDLSPNPSPSQERGEKTYILAWTTTPWTLVGNVALAVNPDEDYLEVVLIEKKSENINFEIGQKIIFVDKSHIQEKILGDEIGHMEPMNNPAQIIDEKYNSYEAVKDARGNIYGYAIREGKELIGKKYKPLFNYYADKPVLSPEESASWENGWKIYGADFVTTEDGTGVVHIAPAFGEDDLNLGNKENLPFIQHVGMDGIAKEEVKDFAGMDLKPRAKDKPTEIREADLRVVRYLGEKIFDSKRYEHSYPHCWRCDTPLINYATSSWFVAITKIKNKMLESAKKINWSPAHIKEGRFGQWLEGARDWSISRQRFWASVIPIWRCDGVETRYSASAHSHGCGNIKVIGSIAELEKLSGKKIEDLHKHVVDKITFKCEKCSHSADSGQAGEMKRVPDVLDCWFESGSMPYAQMHYPFANKEKFENNFPADFIAEGTDQTRAWFYYLHAIANGIKDTHAFNNVIVNGIVLAEDGKKMAKRLQNYPDPAFILDQYGADALRYYLLSSPVMQAEDLNFSESGVRDALRNVNMTLWNVYKFYEMYAVPLEKACPDYSGGDKGGLNLPNPPLKGGGGNILDKWIMTRLNQLIGEVTENMKAYNLPKAIRPIEDFVSDLSTWYLRRSRGRFKSEDEGDKQAALATTAYVLIELAKVMAPFMPFIAENIWQKVTGNNFENEDKSVHLEAWPVAYNVEHITHNILEEMEVVRKIVELGLAAREEKEIKVRQPLSELKTNRQLKNEYENLIKEELNIKNVLTSFGFSDGKGKNMGEEWIIKGGQDTTVAVNKTITEELKMEGVKRELVRFVNNMRKDVNMTIQDRAEIYYHADSQMVNDVFEKFREEIKKDTLSEKVIKGVEDAGIKKEVKIDGETVILGIEKIK